MVVAAGSLLFGGMVLLPFALIVDHPWTLRPTAEALAATAAMGIFSSAFGLMLFYMCLARLGTLTTNADHALLHAHQRQIDEPRLRRNKTLDLRAHRAGIEIVDDVEPGGIVDEPLMRLAIGGRDRLRIGRFRDRL